MSHDPFCHCCDVAAAATPEVIYNRPGLQALRFRIGSFTSFRRAMLESVSLQPALAGLTTRESEDYAITVMELFSAIADVLSFYNERIANEMFLRTAQERDSLLRLTRLIGYQMRPGLAAQTLFAFALQPGAEMKVRTGFKVMSVPGQNEEAQIFETLEAIAAHGDLNDVAAYALPVNVNAFASGALGGPITARPEKLDVGEKLLLFGRDRVEEKTITAITQRSDGEALAFTPAVQAEDWLPEFAGAAKLEGRLRFFGHNAPAIVNVFSPPTPTSLWPKWESKSVDHSLADGLMRYPLDSRVTDLAPGMHVLIDAGPGFMAMPRLRLACIVRTADAPTDIGGFEQLSDTVTYVYLRQVLAGAPLVAGDGSTSPVVTARLGMGDVVMLKPVGPLSRQWEDMGLRPVISDVQPVLSAGGRLDLFVRDASQKLMQRIHNAGVWGSWIDRGGELHSAPKVVVGSGGQLLAFVQSSQGKLSLMDVTAAAAASWFDLGGELTSAPAPVSPGAGIYAVFARGLDRALWHVTFDGTAWLEWQSLKGILATAPVAVSTGTGRMDVAALNDRGALILRRHDGSGWQDWIDLGGALAGEVCLLAGSPDRVDVFARGRDDALWHVQRDGNIWGAWKSLGGVLTSSPSAVRDAAGLHVYARGADGTLAYLQQVGGVWRPWTHTGDGIGGLPDRRKTAIYRVSAEHIDFRRYDYPAEISQGQMALRIKPGAPTLGNLGKGRRVLLRSEQAKFEAQVTAIKPMAAVAGELADHVIVDFTPAPETPLRTVFMRGNIAAAGHGETQPLELVGHGDGGKGFQSFRLHKPGMTFTQSASSLDGTPAVDVRVNGELWTHAPSFCGRRNNQRVYTVRQNDDQESFVTFGDGTTGARLPSGAMNVSATYRVGRGLKGLMKAGQLSIPLERPPGFSAVTNPIPADGAADPETRDGARLAAPNTVKTFGRAVSLADFEAVITGSGLAAKAFVTWVWVELERAVHISVLGPLGTALSKDALARLYHSLNGMRDENKPLMLANLVRVPIVVSAKILCDVKREKDEVLQAARKAVENLFGFDTMALGEAVFLSQIFAALQSAPGVVAVDVDLFQLKHHEALTAVERGMRAIDGNAVQPHIRIYPARPTPPPGQIDRYALAGLKGPLPPVLAAEQAYLEDAADDLVLTAVEAL